MLLAVMRAYPGNNSFMLRVEYGTLCRQYFGRRVAIFCQGQVGSVELEGPRCAIGKETRQGTTSVPWRFSHEKLHLQVGMWTIAMFDLQCRCTSWIGNSTSSTNTGLLDFQKGRPVTRLVSAGHALCQHQQHHPNSSGGALAERFFFFFLSFQPCHPVGQKKINQVLACIPWCPLKKD